MSVGIFKPCCLVILGAAALFTSGCANGKAVKVAKSPRVIVTRPITGQVMDYQDFTGRLEAFKSVEIRARVSGYVTKAIQPRDARANGGKDGFDIKVKEGDFVKEGELLFEIDPRQSQADFNQAEANLKLAISDRNLAEKNANRARRMWANKAMSAEDYERDLALYDKAVAQVGAVEAVRDKAKLYLDYTRVRAPVSGRISRRWVDPGNLCVADTTILTTLVAEDPVYAYFDVDERTYLDLLATLAPGQKSWQDGLKLPVLLRLANEGEFDKAGEIDFVDNRVTATTGTVRMRGVFRNPTGMLKAGLFVRVRLPIGSVYEPLIIPDEAVQSDQEQKYVWVVNSKNVAEYRTIKLGPSIPVTVGNTTRNLRVVRPPDKGKEGKEGLSLGDRVVTSGMQRVRKDLQVDAEDEPPPPQPDLLLVRLLKKSQE